MDTTLTQAERIVAYMVSHPSKEWWYATDFMQPAISFSHPYYIGYEASSRFSTLMKRYPYMFEVAKDGKYRMLRFKFESMEYIQANTDEQMLTIINAFIVDHN